MTTAVIIVFAVFALWLLVYRLAPRKLYDGGRKLLRIRGGLTSKSVRVGRRNWPYLEGGKPDGEPLVLVHGFAGDKDNWSLYAPYFKRDYRLIFPDLPGFGDNDRSLDADYYIAAQARRLGEFLDALSIEKCHLGGNSMGGAIALRLALDDPGRLRSLTLLDNAGVLGTEESEVQKRAQEGESPLVPDDMDQFEHLMTIVTHRTPWVPRQFKLVVYHDLKSREDVLRKVFDQILEEFLSEPYNDRLGEIGIPTQIIWGKHDQLIDVSCALVEHEKIADSELVIFDDVGHVPMIEKPAKTAKVHRDFLRKH